MKKVLVVLMRMGVSSGLTSFYMNYYSAFGETNYKIDFLVTREEMSPYLDQVIEDGCRVFNLPPYKNNRDPVLYRYIYKLLSEGAYDAIHVNIADFRAALILTVAKIVHIPCRIYHSHNTIRVGESRKSLLKSRVYDYICAQNANHLLACTEQAGKDVFKKRSFEVIKNAIHLEKFAFSEKERESIRDDLKISDKFVIGTVCRQAQQKNPMFIIEILKEYNQKYGEAFLLWVGSGPMYGEVVKYAQELGVADKLIMVGDKSNVHSFYSAMDVFVMPSLFEGLGIVYVEAQVSGLPTFASDCVPRDSQITDLISYISLQKSAQNWATAIWEKTRETDERYSRIVDGYKAGYGVRTDLNQLRNYYNQHI